MDLSEDELEIIGIPRDQISPQIAAEYRLQQQMYHSRGGGGLLPVNMVVSLLRLCGYTPPLLKPQPKPIEWSQVPLNAKVKATKDGHKFVYGFFLGVMDGGTLAVRIGGTKSISEFYRKDVSIAAEGEVPEVEEPITDQTIADGTDGMDEDEDEEDTEIVVPAEDDEPFDPEGKQKGPHNSTQWLYITAGDEVLYNGKPAKFVEEGPGDGQLTVFEEGSDEPSIVFEDEVSIPAAK